MLSRTADRGQRFQARARGHSFSRYGATLSRKITLSCFVLFCFFSCGKFVLITNGFVYATLALNRLACHLLTIWKTFSQPASNSDTKQRKCIKNENRFISNYFMLVAFSSPLKFFKTVFPVWKFEVVLGKQYLSVVANHLKSGFSQLFYPELNSRKRWNSLSVLHRNFLKNNNATVREVNSTEIDSFFYVKF